MRSPFLLADLIAGALDGIALALPERGGPTEAGRPAKADAAMTLILSIGPHDAIELTLAGQAMLLNELLVDSAHDALRGIVDVTKKLRTQSKIISMSRLVLRHIDRLERRGNQPYRIEVAASQEARPRPDARPAGAQAMKRAVAGPAPTGPRTKRRPAAATATPVRSAAPVCAVTGGGMPTGEPMVATSWLDEPYEQWLIETPADLAAKAGVAQAAEAPSVAKAIKRDNGSGAVRSGAIAQDVEPALPRQPGGYSLRAHLRPPTSPAAAAPVRHNVATSTRRRP